MTGRGLKITTGKSAITLPAKEAATHRIAIIARTGMGKTYTAKNLAEEFVKARLPFVALDPTGAWWGLRLAANGNDPGLPVTILGGDYGDVPLEPTAGAEVADFVVDNPGHYVLDLSSFDSDAAQDRFAEAFGLRLFRAKQPRAKRSPLMLFVDEADAFAPQQPQRGQEKMVGAFRALMRRGRIFGIGMVPITQRPAALNKNVLTQAEMLIVGQVTGSQDRKALDDWVRAHATEGERDAFLSSLPGLQKGEMWLWSPSWLQVFERVRIRKAETFDSSKTPELDEELPEPKPLTAAAKAALEKSMATTIERAREKDPEVLKKRVAELEADLRRSRKASPAPDPGLVQRQVDRAVHQAVMAAGKDAEADRRVLHGRVQLLERSIQRSRAVAEKLVEALTVEVSANGGPSSKPVHFKRPVESSRAADSARFVKREAAKSTAKYAEYIPPEIPTGGEIGDLPKTHVRILQALRLLESLGIDQPDRRNVAALANYTASGGTFKKYLSNLHVNGYVELPSGDTAAISDRGREVVPPAPAPPSLEELHDAWLSLVPATHQRILVELIKEYPDSLSREELGQRSNYEASGGTFKKYLSRLSVLGAVDYPDGSSAIASDLLFPPGLA